MHPESQHDSLTHLLSGVFAYSYSGYLVTEGEPPHGAPEIGSYLERTRPATTMSGRRGWELYDEIDGYVLVDYVGWVDFHGDGYLSGGGTAQRAGGRAVPFTHSGSYTVDNALRPTLRGERIADSSVILTHAHGAPDAGRVLKFTVLDGNEGKLVASGTMMKG
ncbi:MAG: hypothetical protein M3Y30_16220 [Gemmatimonadota bacterium]|nr:hypothetical protein [Gemmatimonadota bacterium]